jgi:hypothetical protein
MRSIRIELYLTGILLRAQAEGTTHTRRGDFAKAIASYTKAVELRPESGPTLVARGWCHLKLQQVPTNRKLGNANIPVALDMILYISESPSHGPRGLKRFLPYEDTRVTFCVLFLFLRLVVFP